MKLVLLLTQLLLFCQLSVQNIISTGEKSALLIIDVQNCFLEGGSLAVPDGNQVIPVINNLRNKFKNVVLTQDWHCVNHVSFASVHPGWVFFSQYITNSSDDFTNLFHWFFLWIFLSLGSWKRKQISYCSKTVFFSQFVLWKRNHNKYSLKKIVESEFEIGETIWWIRY